MTHFEEGIVPPLTSPDQPGARLGKVRSLGHNSAFRFAAEGSSFVLGLLGSVIAARALGPSGKGLYSSMVVLSLLIAHASFLGLGDAAMVLTGKRQASFQRALSAGLAVAVVSGLAGMGLMWGTGAVAFASDWEVARRAVLVTGIGVPVIVLGFHLVSILNAEERIIPSSIAYAAGTWVTTLAMAAVAIASNLTLLRTALAGLLGASATVLTGAAYVVRGSGLALRPIWDWSYLKPALKYGVSAELSYLLTFAFLRADLLVVYFLAGSELAGLYSVALTGAMVIGLFPAAVSATTFPRIAGLTEEDAGLLLARVFRLCLIGAAGAALLFMPASAVALPLLFGRDFAPAVPAALLLAVGGVVWSCQWVLCRGQAARGRPGLQVRSFGISLGMMVLLDLVLIPLLGINGAGLASVIAPAVGLTHCLAAYHRGAWWPYGLGVLVPGGGDVRDAAGMVLGIIRRRGGGVI